MCKANLNRFLFCKEILVNVSEPSAIIQGKAMLGAFHPGPRALSLLQG